MTLPILEITGLSADVGDFRERQQFDVGVPADLDQFGGQDSHRAVIGRKRLVQLGHYTAYRRRFFDHVDVIARVGHVQGGLDAGDAAADNQNRPHRL